VLDLGCGANTVLADYRTPGREVWGTDFQRHPQLQHPEWFRLLNPRGEVPFPDAHFDAVASVMVLEHVAEPELFLREVARVLRPGGRFIGHTISGAHYITFLRRLFGLLPHSVNQAVVRVLYGRAEVDTFPAFYRLNTIGRLRPFCGPAGLELRDVRRYADPGYFRFGRAIEALAVLADWVLEGVGEGLGRLYLTAVLEKPIAPPQAAEPRGRRPHLPRVTTRTSPLLNVSATTPVA
jgi:SAM-dependent methyltransferase